MNKVKRLWVLFVVLLLVGLLAACQKGAENPQPERLSVVATTTIVGDVVQNVGGEQISLTVLLPPGADPHAFDPSPRDVALVQDADLIFVNGAGLEEFLEPLIESAGGQEKVIDLSASLTLLELGDGPVADEEHADEHAHEGADPHTWTDPHNVMIWTQTIAQALGEADPQHAADYAARSQAYLQTLADLDAWILAQVALIPEEERMIVTDHLTLGYFAQRYGFVQVGAIMPGYSTLAEPSAQELAGLEDAIRGQEVQAVFVGNTVNPQLAQRVADDTGVALVFLYTGSLSEAGGEAATYKDYMVFNVTAILQGLKR